MNIKSFITAAMALLASTACSGGAKQEKVMDKNQKALVVFIGGPVWWGTYPQVMFTFFKNHANDLKGKTVIPFTTHEGSGLASCVEDVKEAFPGANVTKGWSIYGHEVRTNKSKVEKWLNSLNIKD